MPPPSGIGALLNHQMRRWELQRTPPKAAAAAPCIAISRLPHSGGATLGRAVAERLDYGFFDRELLDLIAEEQGVRRRLVEGVDEQVLTGIEKFVTDAFQLRSFTESDYLRHLVRVVSSLGVRGSAVLVGRGAPQILPARRALRVLVVAGREHRAAKLAETEGLTPDDAVKKLAELDEKRAGFSLRQLHVRQDDPTLYDLVLNTETLGVEGGAELVVEALSLRFPGATALAKAASSA